MQVVMAPNPLPNTSKVKVFLAGSIEMGIAVDWQTILTNELRDLDVILYNPRRDDWDSSWVQSIHNPQFKEQVTWEHRAIEDADIVVFYFDPKTKSPITLMELGMVTYRRVRVIVCCPDGFWRKGNVEIICDRMRASCHDSFAEFVKEIRGTVLHEIATDRYDF